MQRFFIGIIILAIVLWFQPWIALLVGVVYSFFNSNNYYELIITGIVIDVIYQSAVSFGPIYIPLYTLAAIALFAITTSLKKRMRMYA
ncbi:MAG: hypothetical protein ACJATX_000212 [Candidatus Paceibacteria bacterium]|jgi:hypothetical protein